MKRYLALALMVVSLYGPSLPAAVGIRLEEVAYPFPVKMFAFKSQQQNLEMAYMDVMPKARPVATVVLLHGKNFSGAYWQETAEALRDAGYRVVIPDQVGFGKSTKPEHYQFGFHQLAANTHALLQSLGITRAHILGHSMGGMIATRYALMFPAETHTLVLVNPLGLEDWKAKGVPCLTVDDWYQQELKQTPEKMKAYELESYYPQGWKVSYNRWLDMQAAFLASPEYPRMAWDQALTYDMILTQPVCYEFNRLRMPVLLIIGQADRTAVGKNLVPEATRKTLGNYPALARRAAATIPNATLAELGGLGHLPQVEEFQRFIEPLTTFLKAPPAKKAPPPAVKPVVAPPPAVATPAPATAAAPAPKVEVKQ